MTAMMSDGRAQIARRSSANRRTAIGIAAMAAAIAIAFGLAGGKGARAASADDLVERGAYLAKAGDCVSCHTAASGSAESLAFAGGLAIATPYGDLVSPNITPDDGTGIGTWTADDFWRALHFGVNKRGEPLYPAMPYVFFTRIARDDSDAIFAFLKSLKPVRHAVDVNHLDWPYDMRFAAMTVWQALWFTPGVYRPDPSKSEPWNRGAYLVQGPGHCGACHTPRNFMGAVEPSERFTGAVIDDWFAPNITPNRRFGIGGYTVDQLTQFFRDGVMTRTVDELGKGAAGGETTEPLPTAVGPMAEVWHNSLRFLTDSDAKAMATYLEALPEDGSLGPNRPAPKPRSLVVGARLFVENCAPCHAANGVGQIGVAPPLAGNPMVIAPSPDNLLSMVVGGQVAEHKTMMMPSFTSTFSNAEIAAVISYVRGAWGNDASPVSADAVAAFRKAAAAGK